MKHSEPRKPFIVHYTQDGIVIDACLTTVESIDRMIQILKANRALFETDRIPSQSIQPQEQK